MVKQLQAFRIDQGICQFDFSDYYAVLGVPVTADATQLRKRYLSIAKRLHPDVYGLTPAEKEKASHYLSKLINPAYQVLNQERERSEYLAMLKLLAKRLIKRQQKIVPKSETAEKLLRVPNSFAYEQAVLEISKMQYKYLDMILDYTGQLSELNLVYLLTQEGYKHFAESTSTGITPKIGHSPSSQAPRSTTSANEGDQTVIQSTPRGSYSGSYGRTSSSSTSSNSSSNSGAAAANQEPKTSAGASSAQEHIRKAESYITQKQWAQALKELRSAIQLDNTNSRCHAMMGFIYLNQKLAGMAKASFQQALKLNPKEALALKYIDRVSGTPPQSTNTQSKAKEQPKKEKGGFFGLFGGG